MSYFNTQATYTFDPMTENCHSLRNFMFFWNTKKIRRTNLKLATKVSVVDDRSEPTILMNLNDGRDLEVPVLEIFSLRVLFEMLLMPGVQIRCGNLTELEIASVVNHYLLPLVKVTYFVSKLSTSLHLYCRRKRKQH